MSNPIQYNLRMPDGSIYGPATLDVLTQWAAEGRVTADTLVAPVGSTQWQRADTIPPLQRALANPSSAVPPAAPTDALGALSGYTAQGAGQPMSYQSVPQASGTNGKATASLILGILGLLCCPLVLSVLAIIFGFMARTEIANSRGVQKGDGMALAGIIMGFIGIPLACIAGAVNAGLRHH